MKHEKITQAVATVDGESLRKACAVFDRLINRRNTIPVLSMIKVAMTAGTGIMLSGTNLDTEAEVPVTADVSEDAAFLISARALSALAKQCGGALSLSLSGDIITATADGVTATIKEFIPVADYPEMKGREKFAAVTPLELSCDALARLFRLTRHCVSDEETRYYLNGVFLTKNPDGNLRAVANDGHRLARIDAQEPWPFEDVIVPKGLVDLIRPVLAKGGNDPCKVSIAGTKMWFSLGGITILAKVIDGTFPNYTRVIPEKSDAIRVGVSLTTLQRLQALASAMDSQREIVKISPDAGTIEYRSLGTDTLSGPCQGTGEPFGMNLGYLLAQARLTPDMTISGAGGGNPFRVTGPDPDALWVIMPARV